MLIRGHLAAGFIADVAPATLIDSVYAAMQTAPAECAKDETIGLVLVSHEAEIDVEESEVVDDGCGDSDEEEEEGGDEEECHSEAKR